jgi:hypothetical protein
MQLECDALAEAVKDLEKTRDELQVTRDDPHAWKWVVIATHNALQGFMVAALEAGSGLPSLTPKSVERFAAWHSNPTDPPPRQFTMTFEDLYKAVKGLRMRQRVDSTPVLGDEQRDRSIALLNILRDRFMHFPGALTWYLELDGLPRIINAAADVCHALAFESNNVSWPLDSDLAERASSAFQAIRANLGSPR